MPEEKKLYSLSEAAAIAKRKPATLRHAIKAGTLPAQKVGWGWVVTYDDLQAWIKSDAAHKRGPRFKP